MRHRLYSERIKRGLTQEQAAKIVKVTRAGYSHIESGYRTPSWALAKRLEQFFGIPASELLAESDEQQLIAK